MQIPASCDGFSASDGGITSGDKTFTSASANFVVGDVGKPITVYGAGVAGASLVTTIASINSATSVELVASASATVANTMWGYGTDYTAVIEAALAAGVQLPKGICGHAGTIDLTAGMKLLGQGSGTNGHQRTTLMWLGAVGGIQLQASTGAAISGLEVGRFIVDGRCAAATGMKLRHVAGSQFFPMGFSNQTTVGVDMGADVEGVQSTQLNDFYNLQSHHSAACSTNTKGVVLNQAVTQGTDHNNFYNLRIRTVNETGLECGNADSNQFFGFWGLAAGTGQALDILGSATANNQRCRGNYFFAADPNRWTVRAGTFPTENNHVWLNNENGAADPTIEAGATVWCKANRFARNCGNMDGEISPSSKTGASYTVTTKDIGANFDNTGNGVNITFNLPAAASRLHYCFTNTLAAPRTLTVAANGSDQIAHGTSNSLAGGNITTSAQWSGVCIVAHGAGQWLTRSSNGVWTVN